jgi:hypothetical protein
MSLDVSGVQEPFQVNVMALETLVPADSVFAWRDGIGVWTSFRTCLDLDALLALPAWGFS